MQLEISSKEEEYLVAIFQLQYEQKIKIGTNDISFVLHTKPPTVTDMLKKLGKKDLIVYKPYYGTSLTPLGKSVAIQVIRRQRLWETFLVKQLGFGWEEIDEVAKDLKRAKSAKLINAIDELLDFPRLDPHGDPIPDKNGQIIRARPNIVLSDLKPGDRAEIIGVKNKNKVFLKKLNKMGLVLGKEIKVLNYDLVGSVYLIHIDKLSMEISKSIASNIFIDKKVKFGLF